MHDKKVLGIIVEYNPLHNGHVYHFRERKKNLALKRSSPS